MSDIPHGVPACITIPSVNGFALDDWEATGRAMREGVRLDFAQPWQKAEEPDLASGQVWMGVEGGDLVTYAVLADDQPANRAREWNEPTWMTGDVLEFFFQAEGCEGYYEFHVTPENVRLQLFFPSVAAFREQRGHRHWAIAESRFHSATRISGERTGWEAVLRVPLVLVAGEPRADGGNRFRFSFSRYDYQPGRVKPVTSTTSPLDVPDFHCIDRWRWAEVR